MVKRCSRCREVKPDTEFHKNSWVSHGLSSYCKKCFSEYTKIRIANQSEERREISLEHHRQYEARNKERLLERRRGKKKKYKDRNRARQKVSEAIARGELQPAKERQCQICLGRSADEYHHEDYAKPLDVIPLCKPCHRKLHRKYKNGLSVP